MKRRSSSKTLSLSTQRTGLGLEPEDPALATDSPASRLNFISSGPLVTALYVSCLTFALGVDIRNDFLSPSSALAVREVLLALSLAAPLALVAVLLATFRMLTRQHKLIRTLLESYAGLILLFGNIYFVLQSFTKDTSRPALSPSPEYLAAIENRAGPFAETFVLYVDSVYYSFVTIATLGYSEVTPLVWYSKLLEVLQVGAGLYVLAVSLNRHFSGYPNPVKTS